MKRFSSFALVFALLIGASTLQACQRTVQVRTGTKVICTNGEVVSDSIRTIRVPAKDAGNYSVKTETITCDKHRQLAELYSGAQKAITANDLKTATEKLKRVVALDPTYRKAKEQLDTISKGKVPVPDTGAQPNQPGTGGGSVTPSATPPSADATPTGALSLWIPAALEGWTARGAAVDPLSVTRQYLPKGTSRAYSLVIYAEQFGSSADAKSALTVKIKQPYPKDAATLTINGHQGYFGTDGRRFAALGFTAGPVMVALEADSKSDTPSDCRDLLEAAAKQLP
jgi:hypothetical protein